MIYLFFCDVPTIRTARFYDIKFVFNAVELSEKHLVYAEMLGSNFIDGHLVKQ